MTNEISDSNQNTIQSEINRIVSLTGYNHPENYQVFIRHDVYGTATGNRRTIFSEVFIGVHEQSKILNAERLELIETHTRLNFKNKPNAEANHEKKVEKLLQKYKDFEIKTVKFDNGKWVEQKCTCVSCGVKYTTCTLVKQRHQFQKCDSCITKEFPDEVQN